MIKVFIYYENETLLQGMQQTAADYFRSQKHTFQLTACSKYKEAEEYLTRFWEKDDIFLFDFSDYTRGIRLAAYLRARNLQASWVCVGGRPSDVFRALYTRPSGYIQDPKDPEHIRKVIRILEAQHRKLEKILYFSFKCEGELLRLPHEKISYFESNGKKVALYQMGNDKTYYFTARLDDIGSVLPDSFLRCHQSYIINMHMIRYLDGKNRVFVLYSNEEVPISRRMYSQAKEVYEKFSGVSGEHDEKNVTLEDRLSVFSFKTTEFADFET